ncbi:type II toxin-antitoxin system VapC family toxin [Pararhizobium arenae]|uniref:type II toxin-antitoxin system VapC family toxin n=1 Tax=Pararhizobium arenae TaxID=1856850 RepID=UPI00094AA81C|nr:type II toxin-antitoxin system VapC family toxin [Pararhizobium arenae]
MRLLLDTHIFIAMVEERMQHLPARIAVELGSPQNDLYLSVATLWEIAIKWRLGKLPIPVPPEILPEVARNANITCLPITEHHALRHVEPEPPTRDPFDRLLLAQCAVESLKLVTIDRALAVHPLALRQ